MKKCNLELSVGLFLTLGMLCLAYLSIQLARMEVLGNNGYEVHALFSNSGGLKTGASVIIAGVEIGRVKSIALDDYESHVVMMIDQNIKIHEDVIASIKTKGLIGEKFIEISPGGSEVLIEAGGKIRETEPAMDIEGLVSKFVHGKL